MQLSKQVGRTPPCVVPNYKSSPEEGVNERENLTDHSLSFFLKGDRTNHGTAGSPKETIEEGSENDHGVPSSKRMQGERGGGAALKENVCQVKV